LDTPIPKEEIVVLDVLFDKWWRMGGVCGILFIIMFAIGIVVQGEPPDLDAPVDEIRDWFADNGEQYLVGDYLIGLGFVFFFLPFLSSLRGILARAEGDPAVWSWVTFLGGAVLLVIAAVSGMFWGTLAYGHGIRSDGDEATIRTLMHLDVAGFTALPLAFIPFVLGTSLVILRSGVFWRWLPIIGLIVVVSSAIAGASLLTSDTDGALGGVGAIGFIGAPIWIILVSVNMILKPEAPAAG
jgi:hypothetical protein